MRRPESLSQWTLCNSGTTNDLTGITYGNGLFPATCYSNQNNDQDSILTSPDGATWTRNLAGSNCKLYGVTYGNGTYVAVGTGITAAGTQNKEVKGVPQSIALQPYGEEAGGAVLTSKDGASWTSISGITDRLFGVAYGNGLFVAVGGARSGLPPNGTSWTGQSLNPGIDLQGICYGNGIFVAAGSEADNAYFDYDDPYLLTSTDGSTWTGIKPASVGQFYGVAYGNGLFVAVGASQSAEHGVRLCSANCTATSPDGSTWTTQQSGTGSVLYGVAYGKSAVRGGGNEYH